MSSEIMQDFDERQYWPSKWSKRLTEDVICAKHEELGYEETKKNKASILSEGNCQYGSTPTEVMDVYGKNLPADAAWFVYIHGGYWVEYTKESAAYCAAPLWNAGIRVCVPDYDLAPKVKLTDIVKQVQTMAYFLLQRAEAEGSRSVWICGHSAGAQLAARLLDEKWLKTLTPQHRSLFKGVILIGGVYNLKPIMKLHEVNDLLKLNEGEAEVQSPLNTVIDFKAKSLLDKTFKTIVVVAENESEVFKQESLNYCKILNENGMDAEYLFLPELDHFDVVENLRSDSFVLTKRLVQEILGA